MGQAEVASVLRDAINTILIAASPMLIAALAIGIVISVLQASTQISEQALSFVPKIFVVLMVLALLWGFISGRITDFALRMFEIVMSG